MSNPYPKPNLIFGLPSKGTGCTSAGAHTANEMKSGFSSHFRF